jgi:CRP/FNR family transcriptional regulator
MEASNQRERHEALRRMPLFSGLTDAQFRQFVGTCRTKRIKTGVQIFSPDVSADRFFAVLTGRVKVYKLSAKGDEQILHLYGPGHTIGEAAMWAGIDYPAHAEALSDCFVLVVTREALRQAFSKHPELALGMLAGMSNKLLEFAQLIEQLALKEVPARLAGALLRLSEESGSSVFRLMQSKRELAAQIGTVSETLSRALRKLTHQGIISVDGSRITILNRAGLAEIAES